MAKKQNNISFAKQAQMIIDKYNKKVEAGDSIAKHSMDKELKTLSEKQEQAKQQMQQQQSPAQMMRYGGGMSKRRFGGDDPTKSSDLNNYTNVDFTGAWQDDPSTPNIDESKDIGNRSFKASKADGAKMRKANEIFRKHQGALRGVRNTRGGDVKTDELKSIIGPEAYNELESAYNTLTSMSTKYGVPAQSFGINDTGEFGGSNLPQWYGYRFDATKWDIAEDPNTGEAVVKQNPTPENNGQYEYVKNEYDPYQIDPKYDMASLAGSTIPLLREQNNTDQLEFDRVAPGYVNYERQREQARQDATVARNVGLQNLRNLGSGRGQAAANALALQTGLQGNVNKAIGQSLQGEANANAQQFSNSQAQNAQIQKAEAVQNYSDRRYVEENEKMRNRAIGTNVSDYAQRLKGNKFAELGLQSNPQYGFDDQGQYVSKGSFRPVEQQAQLNNIVQPTEQGQYSPEVYNPYDQGFQDIEIDQPLQPIEDQYKWYRCGGKLKRRR